MSEDLSKLTCCVVDHGLFFGLARELAKSFGRVLYHFPEWEKGFPTVRDGCVGNGFDEIEACLDFWPKFDEIDCFAFPDIGNGGMQAHLRNMGKPVWGTGLGQKLELDRELFLKLLKQLELEVPDYTVFEGLAELRAHLIEDPDKYVKISQWRADLETFRYRNEKTDGDQLDLLAVRLGPLKDELPLLAFNPIETPIEDAYDGYSVLGQYPSMSLRGPEIKGKCYLGSMTLYKDLPKYLRDINEAFAPIHQALGYINAWSTETRVKGKQAFFIDPCCRFGFPSGDAQFLAYSNWPEIVWRGAHGDLVDPVPRHRFVAQACWELGSTEEWKVLEVPNDVEPFVSYRYPCKVGGVVAIAPNPDNGKNVGSVLGGGETLEEAIEACKEHAAELKHNGGEIHIEAFADAINELEKMDEYGVGWDTELPEPAIAIEEA